MFSHEQLAEEIKEKEQEINKKLDKIVTELTQVALPNLELARELDDFIQAVQDNKFDYSLIEKKLRAVRHGVSKTDKQDLLDQIAKLLEKKAQYLQIMPTQIREKPPYEEVGLSSDPNTQNMAAQETSQIIELLFKRTGDPAEIAKKIDETKAEIAKKTDEIIGWLTDANDREAKFEAARKVFQNKNFAELFSPKQIAELLVAFKAQFFDLARRETTESTNKRLLLMLEHIKTFVKSRYPDFSEFLEQDGVREVLERSSTIKQAFKEEKIKEKKADQHHHLAIAEQVAKHVAKHVDAAAKKDQIGRASPNLVQRFRGLFRAPSDPSGSGPENKKRDILPTRQPSRGKK